MSCRVDHFFGWDQYLDRYASILVYHDYACQFNQPLPANDTLQLPYEMDPHQTSHLNPYQATVLRTEVIRSLTSYTPDILEESILAVFDTVTHLIALE